MLCHPLNSFEIQKHYQNKPKFKGVYSRKNLPEIKDGANIVDLTVYKSIGTHWIAFCVIGKNVTYFDSFEVEYIPKDI